MKKVIITFFLLTIIFYNLAPPKNIEGLTKAEKAKCTADKTGWTVPAGGNDNPAADRETLVALRGMKEAPAPAPAEEEEE